MPGEIIVLDPLAEDPLNAPLQLSGDEANGIALIEHAYPTADDEMQWAGGADTEGDRPASSRPRNRKIPVKLRIIEPTGPAMTNVHPNPSFEGAPATWQSFGNGGAGAFSFQAGERPDAKAGDRSGVFTAQANMPAGSRFGVYRDVPVVPGQIWATRAWMRTQSFWGGFGEFRITTQWQSDPSTIISSVTAAQNVAGPAGYDIVQPGITAPAGATLLRIHLHWYGLANAQPTWILDAVLTSQVAAVGAQPPEYFDGDTPGCYWSGARHGSASVRHASGGPRLQAMIADITAKVAKLHREGGTYRRRLPNTGQPITFDVEAARVVDVDHGKRFGSRRATIVDLEFECRPYGREPEISLASHSETTLPALIFTETGIRGDVPALGRLVIDEEHHLDQRLVIWGIQSRHYSTDPDAALFYQGETLAASAGATTGSPAGASGGSAAYESSLTLGYDKGQVAKPTSTHVGTFRMLGRFLAPSANAGVVSVRLEWAASGNSPFTRNAGALLDKTLGWQVRDLGLMHCPPPPRGQQNASFAVKAKSTAAGDDVYCDWIVLVPVDEGTGISDVSTSAGDAKPPLPDSGQFEITHESALAFDLFLGWGVPSRYEGDYLLLPVAGRERRTLRVLVLVGEFALADGGESPSIPDVSATLHYTPRWSVVPAPS